MGNNINLDPKKKINPSFDTNLKINSDNPEELLQKLLLQAQDLDLESAPLTEHMGQYCNCVSCKGLASLKEGGKSFKDELDQASEPGEEGLDNIKILQDTIKKYEGDKNLDNFAATDPLRDYYIKNHKDEEKSVLDQITNKLKEFLKGKIVVTEEDFDLDEKTEMPEFVKKFDESQKNKPVSEGMEAAVANSLARNFLKNPGSVNELLKKENELKIYITTQNSAFQNGGVMGLYVPPEQSNQSNHHIFVNSVFALESLITNHSSSDTADADDDTNTQINMPKVDAYADIERPRANVVNHEFRHFLDRVTDGTVDGKSADMTNEQFARFEKIRDKLVLDRYNQANIDDPDRSSAESGQFGYMLNSNKNEFLASAFEIYDAAPDALKKFSPELYDLVKEVKGYDSLEISRPVVV